MNIAFFSFTRSLTDNDSQQKKLPSHFAGSGVPFSPTIFHYFFISRKAQACIFYSRQNLALKFPKNAYWRTRYSIGAFTLIKAFSILNNAFTRRFNPGDIRHACLAFYIINNTKNKFINTLGTIHSVAFLAGRARMTTGAMQSNYPYFGSNLPKESGSHGQQLDFPYSPCRMQSPNYYNQSALPNFMPPMPQGNLGQVNGYANEPPAYGNVPISAQNGGSLPIDHQNYYSPQDAGHNCSFHQYAWLKSTSSPENWWQNSTTAGQ